MSKYNYFFALGVGLFATSFSSIFIRLTPTSPLVIAFWRMLLATLGTIALTLLTSQGKDVFRINRGQFQHMILSGFFLALHFATWIMSLFYTSIAESLVIVNSSPLIVLFFSLLFLHERINRIQIAGMILSLCGGLIIALSNLQPNSLGSNPLLGNFLALLGAITVSGYIVIGRVIRQIHEIGIFVYTTYIYGISTIFLFAIALIFDRKEFINSFYGKIPLEAYFFFLLLAFVSTLLGHSLYNYALKEIKAALVSIITLGEPMISSILAIFILAEYPTPLTIIGGSIIMLGVFFALLKEDQQVRQVKVYQNLPEA